MRLGALNFSKQSMNVSKLKTKLKGNPTRMEGTVYQILVIISLSHFLNDMIQSVVPSIYPIIKTQYGFSFSQIGIITLVFQMTSSILQPFTGMYADRHPRPLLLPLGMCFTLCGLCLLAFAGYFQLILLSVALIGMGSSIFHPEASRVTQLASGGKKSLAQSIFQVGGNGGSAVGPLLAAAIVLPFGQNAIVLFGLAVVLAAFLLVRVGAWYAAKLVSAQRKSAVIQIQGISVSKAVKYRSLAILVLLIFSKYFYTSCITSYFTFYLMAKFHVSVAASQLCLFAFLLAFAIGTVIGGAFGDRFGRKYVIWFSILGAAPFALAMPYTGLTGTVICAFLGGFIIASAFSSIVVYATDLMPEHTGLVCGVFFGLMFGLGGLGSAFFGYLADHTGIEYIFHVSSFLPLLGIVATWLPDTRKLKKKAEA